jgi:hypothetical protein
VLELDGVEARADPRGPIGVAGEEDVLGQFTWAESDVVLPVPFWDGDAPVPGLFDAGIRVRQVLSSSVWRASLERNFGRG